MFNMYLIRVDDWGCWLCSWSPPPAGSEAKVSPSSEALRVSFGQTWARPYWQKVSPGSLWEKWQKAGGPSRRQQCVRRYYIINMWINFMVIGIDTGIGWVSYHYIGDMNMQEICTQNITVPLNLRYLCSENTFILCKWLIMLHIKLQFERKTESPYCIEFDY